ncbi:MAG TPA: hypothetical protein VKB64_04200 [Gaiellaceae bacterium]|nr:hypothetical protein [Gaiellaceae bacterium]
MQHWLLVRGSAGRLLPDDVDPDRLRAHSSTRRPSVQKGDLAVCYASGWQTIFAIVEVTGDPENDPDRDRWRFALRPLLALPRLSEAPPVETAGVFPRSLGRHSYVRLRPAQFDAAREALSNSNNPLRFP